MFAQDPLDDIEVNQAFWAAANEAVKAGMVLELYLKKEGGWSDEEIAEYVKAAEAQAWRGVEEPSPWNLDQEEEAERGED